MRICNCALPAMHGGSTKCCKGCPNNYDDGDENRVFYPFFPSAPKKTIRTYEYDQEGRVIKEIIIEE